MPWSGGTYTRNNGTYSGSTVWQSDAAAAVKIRADRHDTHDQDIATGINNCLTKDGQNSPTQNISWGNFKITSLGNGTATTDAAAYGQTITALAWSGATITGTRSTGNLTITVTAANITSSLGYTPANRAGDTFTGAVTVQGQMTTTDQFYASGSNAALRFQDRGALADWTWFSTSNIARLFHSGAGDRITVDTSGNVVASGGITVGGGKKIAKVTLSTSAPGALADGELYLRY